MERHMERHEVVMAMFILMASVYGFGASINRQALDHEYRMASIECQQGGEHE